ncbi:MAG: zf-HC2 domain-containing protein [Pseudomonadales bacterium]
MTHPTQLQLSMHADNALSAEEAVTVTEHVKSCETCRASLATVRDERRFLAFARKIEAPEEAGKTAVPKFSGPLSLRGFALANLGTGLLIWLAQFLWKTLFGELIMNATTRVTSAYLHDIYAMTSAAALYLIEEGTTMFDASLGFVVVSLATLVALWFLLMYRKTPPPWAGVC